MRVTVRALGLLVVLLMVGASVAPNVVPTAPTEAQGMRGDRRDPAAAPFQQAGFQQTGSSSNDATGATPMATSQYPFSTEIALRCPDPGEPIEPVSVRGTATAIPLYQPVPYSTGEFVMVTNTNEHGANLRVAPRALARILRVVPEGEVLEAVGGDLTVDRVPWAYVRDQDGTVGWLVSHMLTGVTRVPGREPLPYQSQNAVACATFTPTPTANPNTRRIQVDLSTTPGSQAPGGGSGTGSGGTGSGGTGESDTGRPRLT